MTNVPVISPPEDNIKSLVFSWECEVGAFARNGSFSDMVKTMNVGISVFDVFWQCKQIWKPAADLYGFS